MEKSGAWGCTVSICVAHCGPPPVCGETDQVNRIDRIEHRRRRGDMIEVFKIINRIDNISSELFDLNVRAHTRGHNKRYRDSLED